MVKPIILFGVDIYFKTNKLKRIFESNNPNGLLESKYGPDMAEIINLRMALLVAAPSLNEIPHNPPVRRHKLKGKRKDSFAVNLDNRTRLIFKPDNTKISDLRDITSIIILSVEDYH